MNFYEFWEKLDEVWIEPIIKKDENWNKAASLVLEKLPSTKTMHAASLNFRDQYSKYDYVFEVRAAKGYYVVGVDLKLNKVYLLEKL